MKQYQALLATEGVDVIFTEDSIEYISEIAYEVNARTENIGARRLYTIMEKVLEDILFDAAYMQGQKVSIDRHYVEERLRKIITDEDLSRYIL